MELSVVVPVYRSAKNAVVHLPLIIETFRHKYRNFEVLFIIDYHDMNSEMDSFIELCEKYSETKIHALNKNYGQHFATLCGYYLAQGDFIACVDEDMSEYMLEICKTDDYKNQDVFYFYYNKNEMYNSSVRKFFSVLYKYLIGKIVNLKKHSTFRIISKELRDKILFTIALLAVFRLGSFVVLPGVVPSVLENASKNSNSLFGLINTYTGGAFNKASIFALGIMPYITSSIIIQLLGFAVPYFQRLQQKEGESGRRKLNQFTRILTVFITLV